MYIIISVRYAQKRVILWFPGQKKIDKIQKTQSTMEVGYYLSQFSDAQNFRSGVNFQFKLL